MATGISVSGTESIWYQDPLNLFARHTFLLFVPSADMTLEAKLNTFVRMSVYFALISFLLTNEAKWWLTIPIVAILTAAIYQVKMFDRQEKKEAFDKENISTIKRTGETCLRPSPENPFMNVLMNEYVEKPDRPQACDIENDAVHSTVRDYFNSNVYRDIDDIYSKNASDRQFYTTPNTQIPNDQNKFANWLYGREKTCKEGNGTQCYANVFTHYDM